MSALQTNVIHTGDALAVLRTLPDNSVNCVVTSPPYFGLRDYGHADQIGLEPTPRQYVDAMVAVFAEVRRVLVEDGTCWMNLGDSYSGGGGFSPNAPSNQNGGSLSSRQNADSGAKPTGIRNSGLPDKSLIGIPWRVAFGLQDDGWILRSDIIWSKPSCMPESVTDRPTRAHEYVFLLVKGQRKSRVVQIADLPSEFVHFSYDGGFQSPNAGSCQLAIRYATAFLDFAEREYKLGLTPLNPQIWQKMGDNFDGAQIVSLPPVERAALLSARFLYGYIPAKEFLYEMHRLGITHGEGNTLLIAGGAVHFPLPPGINRDTDTTFAVNDAGQICKFDFVHGSIITERPSTCNYWYDAEAIQEKQLTGKTARYYGTSGQAPYNKASGTHRDKSGSYGDGLHRNARTVWQISTEPTPFAHFATMPQKLVRRCIVAGCPVGGVVLDPFSGSGTTALVARREGRRYVGIELNPEYVAIAERRLDEPYTLPMLFADAESEAS